MKQIFCALLVVIFMGMTSCKSQSNSQKAEKNSTESIVEVSAKDSVGNELHLRFDNEVGNVTIHFEGDTALLEAQRAASGIWYQNEQYELRGKGNSYRLECNGKVVFNN